MVSAEEKLRRGDKEWVWTAFYIGWPEKFSWKASTWAKAWLEWGSKWNKIKGESFLGIGTSKCKGPNTGGHLARYSVWLEWRIGRIWNHRGKETDHWGPVHNLTTLSFTLNRLGRFESLNRSDRIKYGLLWLREDCWRSEKAIVVIQVRVDSGLDQAGGRGNEVTLKVNQWEFLLD